MVRMVLAIAAGFIGWSILWVGSDQILRSLSPDWYGAHQYGLETAMFNTTPFPVDSTILAISIVRSIVISVMAGFLTAFIAGENRRAPLFLGVILLLFGIFVQATQWNYIPIWYHVIFLVLLVPMTVLGGRLKTASADQGPEPNPE